MSQKLSKFAKTATKFINKVKMRQATPGTTAFENRTKVLFPSSKLEPWGKSVTVEDEFNSFTELLESQDNEGMANEFSNILASKIDTISTIPNDLEAINNEIEKAVQSTEKPKRAKRTRLIKED